MSSASISARGMTGMRRRRASMISGLSGRTADDTTTTSADTTCSGRWPRMTFAPSFFRRRVASFAARSDPATA
jgi:hypothetical protein